MPRIRYPRIFEIEFSNDCNFRCIHCHRNHHMHRIPGHMEMEVFRKLIDELSSFPLVSLFIVGQGEPSLNPRFSEMMEYASHKSIKIDLSTNGTLFDLYTFDEILKWDLDVIGISVDGTDKDSYNQIRLGGDYDKLSSKIREFYAYRNKRRRKVPYVSIRSVIFPDQSPQQISAFKENWKNTVDLIKFNTLSTFNEPINNSWLANSRCRELFFDAHIRYDGNVLLCQHECLYGQDVVIGNIKMNRLTEIWKSESLIERRRLHQKRDFPYVCQMCISDKRKPDVQSNSRKYNVSRNKVVNFLNRYIDVT